MGALLNHVVGGPWPLNAVTENPPGICGGGQSGMAANGNSPTKIKDEIGSDYGTVDLDYNNIGCNETSALTKRFSGTVFFLL